MSGYEKKPTERRALTFWRRQRKRLVKTQKETDRPSRAHFLETAEGLVRTRKNSTEKGALTSCRRQREGLVKIRKESDRSRRAHFLETAEGGTCQDTERHRPRGALTDWRQQRTD